jgi:hypothetical protein
MVTKMKKLNDFWKSVAEWNKTGLKEQLFPNYVFNKWIFIVCFWIMVAMMLVVMNNHNWDFSNKFYYHCPENAGVCQNPFNTNDYLTSISSYSKCPIDDEYFCNQPYFLPGYTYGENKSADIKAFPWFVLCLFAFGFVLNHLWYNKRRIKENDL